VTMEIISHTSRGTPIVMYEGSGTVESLRYRFIRLCEVWPILEFDPPHEPGRELAIAKNLQAVLNAYVLALEHNQ